MWYCATLCEISLLETAALHTTAKKITDSNLHHGTSCNMAQPLMFLLFLIQQIHQINPKLKLMTRSSQTRGKNLLRNQPVNQQQLKHRLSHLLNQLQNNRKQVSYTSFYFTVVFCVKYLFVYVFLCCNMIRLLMKADCGKFAALLFEIVVFCEVLILVS